MMPESIGLLAAQVLKILYDNQIFTSQRWGGVSRYFVELARRVGDVEDVTVCAPLYVTNLLASLPKRIVKGVKIPAFPGARALGNGLARALAPSERFDVVHPTWYERPIASGAILAHTIYDMIAERFPNDHRSFKRQADLKKRAVADADIVFCISESTKRDLIDILGVNQNKVAVTYLATDIQNVTHAANGFDFPYILYVGQRSGYKNFASLLEAFASSPKLKADFGLVCFGGGALSRAERQQMGSLFGTGRGRVSHIGGDDSVLSGLYHKAAVFVFPSLYEGFGIPVLEAMACGCPVITLPVSSMPEVGGDAVRYVFGVGSGGIREALEDQLYDSSASDRARLAGFAQARKFAWNETASSTVAGYLRAVDQKPSLGRIDC